MRRTGKQYRLPGGRIGHVVEHMPVSEWMMRYKASKRETLRQGSPHSLPCLTRGCGQTGVKKLEVAE